MSSGPSNLIVVSGASGTGKSTVLAGVLDRLEGLRFSVSHASRKPRPGERDGVDYHFVGRAEFEALVAEGGFLEHAVVHDELKGTAWSEYDRARQDRVDLLLDLDVQGAAQVRSKLEDAVTVFILPPSLEELERRLRGRQQDDPEVIERRLRGARGELARVPEYDYAIVNDQLEDCIEKLVAVIRAARCRTDRLGPIADAILQGASDR